MNLNYILRQYKRHPRYKKFIAETYVDAILLQQAISETRIFRLLPERRQQARSAHFINDRRKMRRENFIIFMFMQGIMAVTAFLMAAKNADPRLTTWMMASFVFSVGMFTTYKSLSTISRWVRVRSLV